MKKYVTALGIFICAILPFSFSYAELPHDLRERLEQVLSRFTVDIPIHSEADQTELVRAVSNFIRTQIHRPPGMVKVGAWQKVLIHLSSARRDSPLQVSPAPVRLSGETAQDFSMRNENWAQKRDVDLALVREANTLKEDLIHYLKSKYPVVARAAGSCEKGHVFSGVENLATSACKAAHSSVPEEPEIVHLGPSIQASQLFNELLGSTHHLGWDLHLEQVQAIRGAAGYTSTSGHEVRAGEASGSQIMLALTDPVVSQIPLHQVNKEPVTLTSSKESQEFFKEFSPEMKTKTDGTWVGYRYVFYPDAIINTEKYTDAESREPRSIFLMKKVSPETGVKHVIKEGDLEKFEEQIQEAKRDHDLFHGALKLETSGQTRDVERAWGFLQKLADGGHARAQYELARMSRDGRGCKKDLKKAKHYAALAVSQGLPLLPITEHPAPIATQDALGREFVHIPAGRLPGNVEVAAFQADKFPVTREFWSEIMGDMPEHVPTEKRATWNNCPTCPVTQVNWENEDGSPAEVQAFLANLNQREQASGCTYDLPTDAQLWYMIRGDQTGTNQDLYSHGVTSANVNEYVTHKKNSRHPNGPSRQVQPVGNKTLNAFHIELGNVWKMSKDIYDQDDLTLGRSLRGGGWHEDVSYADSAARGYAYAGYRNDYVGFALVRHCINQN